VWGAGTWSFHSADGTRQVSLAVTLQRWNNKAIDAAIADFQRQALGRC
jgi:D-alanyl-D-alanine carboxypeptidase